MVSHHSHDISVALAILLLRKKKHQIKQNTFGASVSEPHTSELNGGISLTFRGCLSIEVNGRAIGTFRIVRYIMDVR